MKLIVMIPCLNEEADLAKVVNSIPKEILGISSIETLLLDDGSTDNSIKVAKDNGVNHIYSNGKRLGLAKTFKAGLLEALKLGADVIVNIDGDGQYNGSDIPKLVQPILDNQADFVIGDRQILKLNHLSSFHKFLQSFGSKFVSYFADAKINDAPSGFRALSRKTAAKLNIFSSYTYTLETLLQAANSGLRITSIPIDANRTLRKSRLIRSKTEYVLKSAVTIFRMFTMYNPMRVFMTIAIVLFSIGTLIGILFLYYLINGVGDEHLQSLILAAIFLITSVMVAIGGVLADLIHYNRMLLESLVEKDKSLGSKYEYPL